MDLTPLMKPRSIAVVGASPRMNRATRVITNLQRFGYAGRVFPINPRYPEIHGLTCYPDLASIPEPADTVVVAIPADGVPDVLTAAVERGVRGAVVLSSGFGEAGPEGRARQATLDRLAAERDLLVCGPNCYGVFNVRTGAAAFSADMRDPLPGPVAVVSQSGGFSHAIAEHLMSQRRVGLSYIVSCGNQGGVTIEDFVDYLVDDGDTAVIGVYVEGFKQPAKLAEVAARARQLGKPIVALKVGRSENARQAVLAHTGSLAGKTEEIEAMLRRSGIIQVANLSEMLDTLALLPATRHVRRLGWRTAVLSGLGGECGRAADAADREGIELPPLSPQSIDALRAVMPDFGNPRNPLDGTGAMYENAEIFPRLVETLLGDDAVDVLAVNMRATVPRPGGGAPSREFARVLAKAVRAGTDRLVFGYGSHAAGDLDQEVVAPLAEAGVPFLESTETAMQALRHAREHHRFLSRPERKETRP
jgi:acetyltransferase